MDEDDDYMDDVKVEPSRDKLKVYETECDSLNNKDVEKLIRKDADDIKGIFSVDVSILWIAVGVVTGD
jgi:uncharacterized protein Yka (UPF0111/DUF47 family)